jgi:hypothetical protein
LGAQGAKWKAASAEREAQRVEPVFCLYGLLAARAGGVFDTDPDSDFDLDDTVALRNEGARALAGRKSWELEAGS